MSTQVYKVLDPLTGTYCTFATYEDCIYGMRQILYSFYISHVHDNPYSVVIENEDGSETWRAATEDEKILMQQILNEPNLIE